MNLYQRRNATHEETGNTHKFSVEESEKTIATLKFLIITCTIDSIFKRFKLYNIHISLKNS